MAQFYLDRDAKSELGFSSTPVTVNGTAGNADRILLRGNAANVTVGPAVEIVDFYGDVSAYSFVNEGGQVAVYRGDVLVASVASNDKGTELRFADGALSMAQDTETGALTVGGQVITDEKAAYAGDQINPEHKSEAGGGSGPVPGKGEEYLLPEDLGAGNVVTSGTGNDTYTTTTADGLLKDAQIVDGSAADEDVLTMTFSKANENGSIVNVEKIVATWTGYTDPTFNAGEISHVNGTEITLNSSRSVFGKGTVSNLQNHRVVAGENISALVVNGAEDGAAVTMGAAKNLQIGTMEGVITVNAGRDFTLGLEALPLDEDNVLSVNAAADVVVTADGTFKGSNHVYANIAKAAGSKGKVTLAFDSTTTVSGDVSGLKVDVISLASGGAHSINKLGDSTTVLLAASGAGAIFTNSASGVENTNTGTARVELGDAVIGDLTISGDDVGTLLIAANRNVEITALAGSGSHTVSGTDLAADQFVLSGTGDVTVKALTIAGGKDDVVVAAGDDFTGRLTVGTESTAGITKGVVVGGQGGSTVHLSGSSAVTGTVAQIGGEGADELVLNAAAIADTASTTAVVKFTGGEGADTVTIKGATTVGAASSGGELSIDMGAGDDTVVLASGSTFAGVTGTSGSLSIDFGDGTADTLKIEKGAATIDLAASGGKSASIKGMDVLDVSGYDATSSSGGLTVKQAQIDAYDFLLKGNGLTVNLDGETDLDLSGLSSVDSATPSMTIKSAAKSNATVTLSSAISETVVITASGSGSGTPDEHLILTNFRANAEDKLDVSDVSGGGFTSTLSYKDGFSKVEDATSLAEAVDMAIKASKVASAGSGDVAAFQFEGDTYVVAFTKKSDTSTGFEDGTDTVIQLTGLYEAADLAASIVTTP